MRFTRMSVAAALCAVVLIVGLAPGAFAASEDSLMSKLNAARSSRGLAALESHWDLVDDAEAHSNVMMSRDSLHHNPNLGSVTTGWLALGENVGVGPSVSSIHTAFMDSPAHRGNILGDYTHVGIGAVRESDNKLWVTVVFMKSSGSTTTTTTAPTTTTSPTSSQVPPVATTTTVVTTTSQPPTTTAPPTTVPLTMPTTTSVPTVASGGSDVSGSAVQAVVVHRYQPRPD